MDVYAHFRAQTVGQFFSHENLCNQPMSYGPQIVDQRLIKRERDAELAVL